MSGASRYKLWACKNCKDPYGNPIRFKAKATTRNNRAPCPICGKVYCVSAYKRWMIPATNLLEGRVAAVIA